MLSLAYIGLGSNLGDRRATLEAAIAVLTRTRGVHLRKVSSFHESEPVGGPPGQGKYLNAAAVVETELDAHELLRVLHEIEAQFGRVRNRSLGRTNLGSRLAAVCGSDRKHAGADYSPSSATGASFRP